MPTGVIPWRPDPVAPRPNTLAFMPMTPEVVTSM